MATNIEEAVSCYQKAWERVRACERATNIADDWDSGGFETDVAYADLEEARIGLLSWLADDKLTEFEELSKCDDKAGQARLLRFIRELQTATTPSPCETNSDGEETLYRIRKGLLYVAEAIDHAKATTAFDERMATLKCAADSIEDLNEQADNISDPDYQYPRCSNCGKTRQAAICECGWEFSPLTNSGFLEELEMFLSFLSMYTDCNGAAWLVAKQNNGLSEQLRQHADEIASRFLCVLVTARTVNVEESIAFTNEPELPIELRDCDTDASQANEQKTAQQLRDERDLWLLEACTNGDYTYPDLLELHTKEAPKHCWIPLEHRNSVEAAVKRAYKKKHGKPWPHDRRGKRRTRKHENTK